MHKIVAIVGMAGAGKSTAADVFAAEGYHRIYFGEATMDEMNRRDLEINEKNESMIREKLREEMGMDAYAKLNEPKVRDECLKHNVVIDGLYSWQEYTYLKPKFKNFYLVAIYASPKTRHERLAKRPIRPLTSEEAKKRDYSEIENLRKSDPIALADFTVLNESSHDNLRDHIRKLINSL
jgi:dephospho-CoA kinase